MTTSQKCPVVGFDHHSASHADDPVGVYRELRATAPVAWTEAHGGYWVPRLLQRFRRRARR